MAPRPTSGESNRRAQVTDELGAVVVFDVLAPFGGLGPPFGGAPPFGGLGRVAEPDMFGHFFDDADLFGAPLPVGGGPVGFVPCAGGLAVDVDVEALVVTTCGLVVGVENAKAAAVPPPTSTPEMPRTATKCFNLGRI
jgi:hypothetical protein